MERFKLWLYNIIFDLYSPTIIKIIEDYFFEADALEIAGFSFPRDTFPFATLDNPCSYYNGLTKNEIREKTIDLFQRNFFTGYNSDDLDMLESLVLVVSSKRPIISLFSTEVFLDLYKRYENRKFGPLDKMFAIIEEALKDNETSKNLFDISKRPLFQGCAFPRVKDLPVLILQNTKRCIFDIREFSAQFAVTYDYEGEIKTFYNYMNLMLHNFSITSSIRPKKEKRLGYFICSAIHPVYDDYVDSENFDNTFPERLGSYLNGFSFDPRNSHELTIFTLLEELRQLFPFKKHPFLWEILSELHKAQIVSRRQLKENLSQTQILEISFEKGGLAFAFYGYIACGGLSSAEFAHFYAMGAIFQLMDDLHDVEDDLRGGVSTVFTKEYREYGEIRKSIIGFVAMQNAFEKNTGLVYDFNNRRLIRLIELIGIRYDTTRFMALSSKYINVEVMKYFRKMFFSENVSIEKFFQNTREHENLDNYILIIERLMRLKRIRTRGY